MSRNETAPTHTIPPAAAGHTLADGREIAIPPHEVFYEQLTTRNRAAISAHEQQRLRTAPILIAGCGAVGGAMVELLVRAGAERLMLADPATYAAADLGIGPGRLQDIGRNRAEALRDRVCDINPYAVVGVDTRGILAANVTSLVRGAALIVDGIAVTDRASLQTKVMLHRQAKRWRVPVIAGHSVACLQVLDIHDYRRWETPVLFNVLRPDEAEQIEPARFLRRLVPARALPAEALAAHRGQTGAGGNGLAPAPYAAQILGPLGVSAALSVLAGRPVRRRVLYDVHGALRPIRGRAPSAIARVAGLARLVANLPARGRPRGHAGQVRT